MQIHEVTAGQIKASAKKIGSGVWDLTKGVASGIGDELETMAFGSPLSRTNTSADELPAKVAPATAPAAKPPLKPVGFNAANIMQQSGMQKYAEKPKPNYAQTGQVNYKPATVTVNSPGAPKVNAAATPQQYTLDGNPLDPKNPIHAKLIAQMQSQGVINATTPTAK
jgi:hypothetical protein